MAQASSSSPAAASESARSCSAFSRSPSTLIAMSPWYRRASVSVHAIVELLSELDGARQRLARGRVLAQPVLRFARARERPPFPRPPRALRARHRERSLVEVDRREALHPSASSIAGHDQGVDRPVRHAAVRGVEVDRGLGRALQVVGGVRAVPRLHQRVGDPLVQAQALALGEARIRDLADGLVAEPPARPPCRPLRERGSRRLRGHRMSSVSASETVASSSRSKE